MGAEVVGSKPAKKLDPKDFMFCQRTNEKLVKKPGEINGQQFILEDLDGCEVLLLDHTAQVHSMCILDCTTGLD